MQKINEFDISFINKTYFWDIDLKRLDIHKSKRLIIERIATLGNTNELKWLFRIYGKKEIINTLLYLNYLDPKTLNFFSLFFDIPISKFKCFTRTQLTRQQFNS